MATCDESWVMASQFDPRPYSVRNARRVLHSKVGNKDKVMRIRKKECARKGNKDCPCYTTWMRE